MTTGNDVLAVAVNEIGVTESPANSNKVKYNTWFYGREVSGSAYPWCMTFVQWCYNRAGTKLPYATASCSALLNWYIKNHPERVITEPSTVATLQPGDIVIYTFGHTGILETANADASITVIEGNTSPGSTGSQSNGGGVFRRTRSMALVTACIRPISGKETGKEAGKEIEKEHIGMTGKEIYEALQAYLREQPVPQWAEEELSEAVQLGITDGSNPTQLLPRYQAAIMVKRAKLSS